MIVLYVAVVLYFLKVKGIEVVSLAGATLLGFYGIYLGDIYLSSIFAPIVYSQLADDKFASIFGIGLIILSLCQT